MRPIFRGSCSVSVFFMMVFGISRLSLTFIPEYERLLQIKLLCEPRFLRVCVCVGRGGRCVCVCVCVLSLIHI